MFTLDQKKEHLGYSYIHMMASFVGLAYDRPQVDDDSIDVILSANGKIMKTSVLNSPRIELQVKASTRHTAQLNSSNDHIAFQLSIKNYNDLRGPTMCTRLLVIFLLPENEEDWLNHNETELISRKCAYWCKIEGLPEVNGQDSVTVKIPKTNILSPETLKKMFEIISKEEEIPNEIRP